MTGRPNLLVGELFFPIAAAGPELTQIVAAKALCFRVRSTRRVPVCYAPRRQVTTLPNPAAASIRREEETP